MPPGPDEGTGDSQPPRRQAHPRACPDRSGPDERPRLTLGRTEPPNCPDAGRHDVLARVVIARADGRRDMAWLVANGPPDLGTVNTLARLQLACRRRGDQVRLEKVSRALAELLELTGLRAQFERQPELGEEPVRLEEGMDPGDPVP
jgi:hypothetical protein